MLATAAAVGVNTFVSIQDDREGKDIAEQLGVDIVIELRKDLEWYGSYDGADLTEAIIARGRNRVEKGWGCKHVGFRYSDDGELGQWCEDACIWAGGDWRITQSKLNDKGYYEYGS